MAGPIPQPEAGRRIEGVPPGDTATSTSQPIAAETGIFQQQQPQPVSQPSKGWFSGWSFSNFNFWSKTSAAPSQPPIQQEQESTSGTMEEEIESPVEEDEDIVEEELPDWLRPLPQPEESQPVPNPEAVQAVATSQKVQNVFKGAMSWVGQTKAAQWVGEKVAVAGEKVSDAKKWGGGKLTAAGTMVSSAVAETVKLGGVAMDLTAMIASDTAAVAMKVGSKKLVDYLIFSTQVYFMSKETLFLAPRKRMEKAAGKDANEYVQFTKVVNKIAIPKIMELGMPELEKLIGPDDTLKHAGVIKDIIEVNLNVAFANLAEQALKNKDKIPAYDNQSTLVNIITLLMQKVQASEALDKHRRQVPPSTDQDAEYAIVADEILKVMFPNGFNDWMLPPVLNEPLLIYPLVNKLLRNALKDELKKTHESLILDPAHKDAYEKAIKAKAPGIELGELLKIPSAGLKGAFTQFIQSDDRVIGLLTNLLSKIMKSGGVHPEDAKDLMMTELSQEKVAEWLVASVQTLMQTKDPVILNAGVMVDQTLQNLTLTLLAKGVEFVKAPDAVKMEVSATGEVKVVPLEQAAQSDAFVKNLGDTLVAQFKSLKAGEKISPDALEKVIAEFTLPDFVKEMIADLAVDKVHILEDAVKGSGPLFDTVEQTYNQNFEKIKKYENSAELLTISQNVSDQIMKKFQAEDQLMGAVSLEELMETYLPGVKFDLDLATWLKSKIMALRTSEGTSKLIAKGVQSMILLALDQTIQSTFKGNSENYAAQVLRKFNEAPKVIQSLTPEQRKDLDKAYEIQDHIDALNKRIANLKVEIEQKPEALPDGFNAVFSLKRKEIKAQGTIKDLEKKQLQIFTAINNALQGEHKWSAGDIPKIEKALSYRSANLDAIETDSNRFKMSETGVLKKSKDQLEQQLKQPDLSLEKQDELRAGIESAGTLIELLAMGTDNLKLFSDLLQVNHTLIHMQKDKAYYTTQLNDLKITLIASQNVPEHREQEINAYLHTMEKLDAAADDLAGLNLQLDKHLSLFQNFFNELAALAGLDEAHFKKENLPLPDMIKDMAWGYIEAARKETLPRLLFSELRGSIKPLLDKMQNQEALKAMTGGDEWGKLAAVVAKESVSQLQENVTNFDEIAKAINDAIPGATNLHKLIAVQLKQVIRGKEKTFQESRQFIADYIESLLLQHFLAIAKIDEKKSVLGIIKDKLSNMTIDPVDVVGKTPDQIAALENEKAEEAIMGIMHDIFKVSTAEDLKGVPPMLQKIVFNTVKEEFFKLSAPIVKPMIERSINLEKLNALSGSKVMGQLAEQLGRDIFMLLPYGVSSYRNISLKIFKHLTGADATEQQADAMTGEINKLVMQAKDISITNKAILHAFEAATGTALSVEDWKAKMHILKQNQAKEDLKNVIMSPEEIVEFVAQYLPHLDEHMQKQVAVAIQTFTHGGGKGYRDFSAIAGQYIEGVMIRFFIQIAEKNPAVVNTTGIVEKDTILIIYDKIAAIIADHGQKAIKKGSVENLAEDLNNDILINVLGFKLESPVAVYPGMPPLLQKAVRLDVPGMPLQMQEIVHKYIKGSIGQVTGHFTSYVSKLMDNDPEVIKAKEELTKFAVNEAKDACAAVAVDDLSKMFVPTILDIMARVVGPQHTFGTNVLGQVVEVKLEEFAKSNLSLAKGLLSYARPEALMERLDTVFKNLATHKELQGIGCMMAGNALLKPMNTMLNAITKFEEEKGAEFNQKMMAEILNAFSAHLEYRQKAKAAGTTLTHEAFVAEAGKDLHPAVPVTAISYDNTIDEIGKRIGKKIEGEERVKLREIVSKLYDDDYDGIKIYKSEFLIAEMKKAGFIISTSAATKLRLPDEKTKVKIIDLLRKEGLQIREQHELHIYIPMTKNLMDLMFPNGKADLDFVPPNLREIVWKELRTYVGPVVMQKIVENLFDENIMTQILLSSLEAIRDNLSEEITVATPVKANPLLTEAGSRLIKTVIKDLKKPNLPESLTDYLVKGSIDVGLIDPKKIDEAIGISLTGIFNSTFIKDKLALALRKATERDEFGEPLMKADLRPKAEKREEKAEKLEIMKKDLEKVMREVIDVSISYKPRVVYHTIKTRFMNFVSKAFGKYGVGFVKACGQVFDFIFCKILYTILYVLTYPIKIVGKELLVKAKDGLYKFIKLDENLKEVLEILTQKPTDQPVDAKYPVYHENVLFNMMEAVRETVEETIDNPKVHTLPPAA